MLQMRPKGVLHLIIFDLIQYYKLKYLQGYKINGKFSYNLENRQR